MRTQEQVNEIVRLLMAEYPLADCTLDWNKAYELLFSVRLAAQCTDERVNKITPALFARFPTLEAFAEADVAEVEEYVRSCGFYHSKARDIVACANVLLEKYGGELPHTMEELTGARPRTSSSATCSRSPAPRSWTRTASAFQISSALWMTSRIR